MKRKFSRLLFGGLFVVSLGSVGAVFGLLGLVQPAFGAKCPECQTQNVSCPGTGGQCECYWNSATSQYDTDCVLTTQLAQ